ncbi:hypothetical protein GGR53DRAFT_474209 [Hypoxylon sp. FL1150]|nr:hypothetical protein GGR53DRAFT_474209 [Hypoxylon sp. FL1150]
MADSMCGPSNAAKGLTRHLDQDRSLQRDRFTTPSGPHDVTQGFRNLRLDRNAEFSSFQQQNAVLPGPLHHQPDDEVLYHRTPSLASKPIDWAAQFNQRGPSNPSYNLGPSSMTTTTAPKSGRFSPVAQLPFFPSYAPNQVSYHPQQASHSYGLNQASQTPLNYLRPPQTSFQNHAASAPSLQGPQIQRLVSHYPDTDFNFDDELRAWCAANGPESEAQVNEFLQSETTTTTTLQEEQQTTEQQQSAATVETHQLAEPDLAFLSNDETARAEEQQPKSQRAEDSELAQAAQQILDSVASNESAKFRESAFMQMMRRIAAQDLVVRDNALVDAPQAEIVVPKPATVEDEFIS